MKYKELPATETNEFKIGDKVRVYDSGIVPKPFHTVLGVYDDELIVDNDTPNDMHKGMSYSFQTCRKLIAIEPREFLLRYERMGVYSVNVPWDKSLDQPDILVREVLED